MKILPVHSSSQSACLPLRVVEDDVHGLQAHHCAVDAQRMLFIQGPRHVRLHTSQECQVSVPVGRLTGQYKLWKGPVSGAYSMPYESISDVRVHAHKAAACAEEEQHTCTELCTTTAIRVSRSPGCRCILCGAESPAELTAARCSAWCLLKASRCVSKLLLPVSSQSCLASHPTHQNTVETAKV